MLKRSTSGRPWADTLQGGAAVTLRFPGVTRPVRLLGAPAVQEALAKILNGWPPTEAPDDPENPPVSTVVGVGGIHALSSTYLDEPLTGLPAASAACGVIADLGQDYFEERPGCFSLHCGAFTLCDRLIAVTGPKRAGKSTLVARLTAEEDIQVWCDDMLPIESDGLATGLGIAPRLRLPLPGHASDRFKAHVARWLGPHDDRYGYVCAPTIAPHGARAKLSALIVLDRRAAGPARLHRLGPDAAVHHLLTQNMSDLQSAEKALAKVQSLAERMICLQMVYADLEDAVALLRGALGGAAPLDPDLDLGPELPLSSRAEAVAEPAAPDQVWERQAGIAIRRHGASSFLWRPGEQMIWQLNAVAGAVWALLEIPGSAIELADALSELFPDIAVEQLVADVAKLLGALAAEDLVVPAG